MTTIITHPGGTIYPTLISGYESEQDSGNIEHRIPGRPNPDYSLRPATLRAGTLSLVFRNAGTESVIYVLDEDGYVVPIGVPSSTAEEASLAAADAHAAGEVLTLANAERASVLMTYILRDGGRLRRRLDPQTRSVWLVDVDFQEVML
ncbi:hypothetical protein J2X03_003782 [Microbacterium trichothecenolyticum]|uniref:hypothetical protein n=1 Tax=Microbacterium trichothecenolyticum TaxID=69370 RepID=UPI002863DFB0|nr:hypothetical protein [Microbacterium trichothecenolyticum]MDR7113880.1 hypothetical protein [Microbacterium trichothecenolyticum]